MLQNFNELCIIVIINFAEVDCLDVLFELVDVTESLDIRVNMLVHGGL